jgi:hypothetical protein
MFTQPSVNQIASTYQGNPAPLNAKVDADKKQHGGIPQDLRQLMAAYDIAQGKQNMGIQQALQIPTNMPTVNDDMQERARQALQARAMQQAQEMQRKNGMPNIVPPGTPRPPMQPQGLDSLRTNVGEGYAGGGIIGNVAHFDGRTGSNVEDPTEKNKSWIERFLYSNISPAERARKDALEAQAEAGRTTPTKLNEERDRAMAEVNRADPNKTQETLERLGMVTRQEQPTQQVIGQTPPAPPRADVPPAPPNPRVNVNPPAPTGGITNLAPAADTEALAMLKKDMRRDPEAEAAALKAKYLSEVGNKDLSIYDQMAQELKARKERLNAPKAGYDAMMEYLEQVALGGGRTSAQSGAIGANRQKQLQMDRQSQQDVLMEKILDLGAKKAEAQYGEKKGMFDMTQTEKNTVYEKAYQAAKAVNASDDEAKKLAAQAVEKELDRKNQIRAAQIGAQDRDQLMNRAKALMAVDKTLGLEEAMKRAALAAGATSVMSTESKDKAKGLEELRKLGTEIPVAVRSGNSAFAKENRRQYEAGVAALESKYGPLISGINALPSAGGPTSSNVRSQADSIIAGGR